MEKKILFFYLKTGAGHISAANAVEQYFSRKYSDTKVVLVDGFKEAHPIIKILIEEGYKNIQTVARWFYSILYACNKVFFIAKLDQIILSWFVKPYVKKMIIVHKPQKIVIFHFFLVKPIVDTLKDLAIDIPLVTIITDPFTVSRLRSLEKNMRYIVYSDSAKEYINKCNVPLDNISVYPIILNEKFNQVLSKPKLDAFKMDHGISRRKKILLIIGGGDGIPKGKRILTALQKENIKNLQIIMVCGRNKRLLQISLKMQKANPDFDIKVYGFTDLVYELMNCADIVITKGGPATLMEILMLNKIPIINSYIREQEKGNMEFVVKNKLGFYEPNISKMIPLLKHLLKTDLSKYHNNITALHLENGTEKITNYLCTTRKNPKDKINHLLEKVYI